MGVGRVCVCARGGGRFVGICAHWCEERKLAPVRDAAFPPRTISAVLATGSGSEPARASASSEETLIAQPMRRERPNPAPLPPPAAADSFASRGAYSFVCRGTRKVPVYCSIASYILSLMPSCTPNTYTSRPSGTKGASMRAAASAFAARSPNSINGSRAPMFQEPTHSFISPSICAGAREPPASNAAGAAGPPPENGGWGGGGAQ
jgi:hypothetical protein